MQATTGFQKMPLLTMPLTLLTLMALIAMLPIPARSQDVRIQARPDVERIVLRSSDAPMIGVTTVSTSERADTLGLRVESIEKDSPAEKAGLKAGDRLQAVNGLNLRADRADAGQEDYAGVLNRRLQREVQRTKAGESIELRVLSGGAARTVKVTPAKGSEFMKANEGGMLWRGASRDRAVIGATVASTGTVRDSIGVFVQAVTKGGPAEKAGIIEGDRIAAINGVSLRVAPADLEDRAVGAARTERLSQTLEKLKAGEVAELTVVTAGRSRTVRVTTAKASDLSGSEEASFIFRRPDGETRMLDMPGGERLHELMPRLQGLEGLRGPEGLLSLRSTRGVRIVL